MCLKHASLQGSVSWKNSLRHIVFFMFVEEVWSQSSKWYQTWDDQLLYSRENGIKWAVILYRKSMGSIFSSGDPSAMLFIVITNIFPYLFKLDYHFHFYSSHILTNIFHTEHISELCKISCQLREKYMSFLLTSKFQRVWKNQLRADTFNFYLSFIQLI